MSVLEKIFLLQTVKYVSSITRCPSEWMRKNFPDGLVILRKLVPFSSRKQGSMAWTARLSPATNSRTFMQDSVECKRPLEVQANCDRRQTKGGCTHPKRWSWIRYHPSSVAHKSRIHVNARVGGPSTFLWSLYVELQMGQIWYDTNIFRFWTVLNLNRILNYSSLIFILTNSIFYRIRFKNLVLWEAFPH